MRRRFPLVSAFWCFCFLVLIVAVHEAEARASFEIGIADDQAFVHRHLGKTTPYYNLARGIGAQKLRVFVWGPNSIASGKIDRVVDDAYAHGFEPQLTLHWNNWHISPEQDGFTIPRYLTFVAEVVRRYPYIRNYSVLNEPDLSFQTRERRCGRHSITKVVRSRKRTKIKYTMTRKCQNVPVGARYRDLFRWTYAVIKRIQPRASVWAGETSPNTIWQTTPGFHKSFFADFACLRNTVGTCRGLMADGYAHHPYQRLDPYQYTDYGVGGCERQQGLLRTAAKLKTLRTQARKKVPLLYTEFGYMVAATNPYWPKIDENEAARMFPRALQKAKDCGVQQMTIYHLTALPAGAEWDTSLVRRDGTRRPVYDALAQWARRSL